MGGHPEHLLTVVSVAEFTPIFQPQWSIWEDDSMQDSSRALEMVHRYVTPQDLSTFARTSRLKLARVMYESIIVVSLFHVPISLFIFLALCLLSFPLFSSAWHRYG